MGVNFVSFLNKIYKKKVIFEFDLLVGQPWILAVPHWRPMLIQLNLAADWTMEVQGFGVRVSEGARKAGIWVPNCWKVQKKKPAGSISLSPVLPILFSLQISTNRTWWVISFEFLFIYLFRTWHSLWLLH